MFPSCHVLSLLILLWSIHATLMNDSSHHWIMDGWWLVLFTSLLLSSPTTVELHDWVACFTALNYITWPDAAVVEHICLRTKWWFVDKCLKERVVPNLNRRLMVLHPPSGQVRGRERFGMIWVKCSKEGPAWRLGLPREQRDTVWGGCRENMVTSYILCVLYAKQKYFTVLRCLWQ